MAWRRESSQWGSNARLRASPHAAQPSASSAATAATTIAAVESLLEDFDRACVRAGTVDVDLRVVIGWVAVVVGRPLAAVLGNELDDVEVFAGVFVLPVAV